MTPVYPSIGASLIQPACVPEKIVESPTPCACRIGWVGRTSLCCATIFEIEHADLRVSSTGDHGPVARVGHELDRKDVCMMTGAHTRVQGEGLCKTGRGVVPNVKIGIIRTRSEEVATGRPTAKVSKNMTCYVRRR